MRLLCLLLVLGACAPDYNQLRGVRDGGAAHEAGVNSGDVRPDDTNIADAGSVSMASDMAGSGGAGGASGAPAAGGTGVGGAGGVISTDAGADAPTSDGPPNAQPDVPATPSPAAFACTPDPALRVCFTFDEGAGTTAADRSGLGNNGTTDAAWVPGVAGTALRFTGTEKVVVSDAALLKLSTAEGATLEAWVRPTRTPTDGNIDFVIGKWAAASGYALATWMQRVWTDTGCAKGVLALETWAHIAMVLDSTRTRLFRDGQEISSCGPLGLPANTAPLTIGNLATPDPSTAFIGDIDMVRVYARARTPAEICADANGTWSGSSCSARSSLCGSTVMGTGADGLIDDLEDGDVNIAAKDGRVGSWRVSASDTAKTMPAVGPAVPMAGGAPPTPGRALRLSGTDPSPDDRAWGAHLAADIVADRASGCYDASAYSGVKLSLKGKPGGKIFVTLRTADVRAVAMLAGHHRKEVTLAADWQDVTIKFSEFAPGWGSSPAPTPDPRRVYGITIESARANPAAPIGEFDFWIDNVQFTK